MSGIAGLFLRDGCPVSRDELQRLHQALGHRGRDGGRIWISGSVGFSHQLLRTCADGDGQGNEPVDVAGTGLAITFDGRLDNRADLLRSLDTSRVETACAADHSSGRLAPRDAILALHAYQRWGEGCAARLLGDFAFAIWDARARRLFCARDVMGIRPFYYAEADDAFVFASELASLLASGRVDDAEDEGMVAEYLANQIRSREATLYRHVRRLPAAHWMTIDRDRIVVRRYWRLDPAHEIRYRHEQEYADHFCSLFEESVACRLRSDRGAVAAYLSGGVDSSSVVGMTRKLAAERRAPPVETFSMVFRDDPTADESAHITEVERFWEAPSHRLPGTLPDAAGFWDQVRSNRDVPDLPSEHLIAPLRASISSHGFRVVLTGAGGDNGFSGSLYHYADLLGQRRLLEAWRQLRADARVSDVGWSPSRIFTMGVVPLLPRWFKNAVRPLARRAGWPGGPPRWIPAGFTARVSLDDRLRVQAPEAASFASHRVREAFENGSVGVMLEMSERSAARLGLEERHPFFDRRIMEFALAIPEMERWRGTCTKRVLRLAMKDLLPPSVRARRDKADFSVHVVRALQILGGSDLLDHLEIASRGWVDERRVSWMYRQMMQRFRDGDPEYTEHMFPLWMIAGVELWARTRGSSAVPAAALAESQMAAPV